LVTNASARTEIVESIRAAEYFSTSIAIFIS
jgi:hypothetical protein